MSNIVNLCQYAWPLLECLLVNKGPVINYKEEGGDKTVWKGGASDLPKKRGGGPKKVSARLKGGGGAHTFWGLFNRGAYYQSHHEGERYKRFPSFKRGRQRKKF